MGGDGDWIFLSWGKRERGRGGTVASLTDPEYVDENFIQMFRLLIIRISFMFYRFFYI